MGNLCSSGAEREKKEDAAAGQMPDKPGDGEGDALLPKDGDALGTGGEGGGLFGAGKDAFQGVVDKVKEEGEEAVEEGKKVAVEKGKAVVEDVVAKVEEGVKSVTEKVTGKAGDVEAEGQKVAQDAESGVAGLSDKVGEAGQDAGGLVSQLTTQADAGVKNASERAGGMFDDAAGKLTEEAGKAKGATETGCAGVMGQCEQQATTVSDTFNSAISDGQAKIGEAANEAKEGLQQRAENRINEAVDAAKLAATNLVGGGPGQEGEDVVTREKPEAKDEGGECFLDKARSLLETHRNSVDSGNIVDTSSVQSALDSGKAGATETLESGKASATDFFNSAVESGKSSVADAMDTAVDSSKTAAAEALDSGKTAAAEALDSGKEKAAEFFSSSKESGEEAATEAFDSGRAAVSQGASDVVGSAAGALSWKNEEPSTDSAKSPEHEVARDFVESILDKATQLVSQEQQEGGAGGSEVDCPDPTVDRGEETLSPKKRGVMFVSPDASQEVSPSPTSSFPTFSPPDSASAAISAAVENVTSASANVNDLPTPPPTPPTLRNSLNAEGVATNNNDDRDYSMQSNNNNNNLLTNNPAVSPTDFSNGESMETNSFCDSDINSHQNAEDGADDESIQRVAMEVTNKAVQDAIKIVTENGNGNNNHNTLLTNNNICNSTGASPMSSPEEDSRKDQEEDMTTTDSSQVERGSPTSDLMSDTSGGLGSVSESLSSYDPAATFRQDGVVVSGDAAAAAAAASKVCDAVTGHFSAEDLPPPPPSPPSVRTPSTVNGSDHQQNQHADAANALPPLQLPTEVPSSLPDSLCSGDESSFKPTIVIDSPDCAHNTDNLPLTSQTSDPDPSTAAAAAEALI
ncbi:hypothetical protein PoB_003759600 [Plakobranchus ocellatus]|uniref:Uncharacterized protein n=1 Tax=Plakobranchus ocellatus TaxID=259542 RepID=A0AAV4ASE3_9GAST|nr:hypothetical protein PoB_003759600 [Plakobranchus ocellatus]